MTAASWETTPNELRALVAFYRATGCDQMAENLERGWFRPDAGDRRTIKGIRAAAAILAERERAAA